MSQTLTERAARYFGVEKEPRTSIRIGRYECFITAYRRGPVVMHYSERGREPRGTYVHMTGDQLEDLIGALEHVRPLVGSVD